MQRYLAILWNPRHQGESAVAADLARRAKALGPEWNPALDEPGMLVLTGRPHTKHDGFHLLDRRSGVILGTLFPKARRGTDTREIRFDEARSRDILTSRGKLLIDRYWGAYVAILHDALQGRHHVVRDPTGGLPCFTLSHEGVQVVCSSVQDLERMRFAPFSINWHYVAAFLMFEYLRLRETGLAGVTEVQAGECLTLEGGSTVASFHWDPRWIGRQIITENFEEAARLLREALIDCTDAWAGCYDTIMLELSGGLDSSIVAGCLARAKARPKVICVNFTSGRPEDSEWRFARMAADHARYDLLQKTVCLGDIEFDQLFAIPKLASPHVYMIGRFGYDDAYTELARGCRSQAFFSGQGGDHIFHQNPTALIAADYVYTHGFHKGLWPVVRDAARVSKLSVWSALRGALKHGLLRRPVTPLSEIKWNDSFLSADLLATLGHADILHPWLRDTSGVAPEKVNQIANLLSLQGHYVPFGRAEHSDLVYPIFSQPVVERCLQVPSYILVRGGKDRALARHAFAGLVPAQILGRHSKADVTNFYNSIVSRHGDIVRELLLEGELSSRGMLNKPKLEKHLSPEYLIRGDQICDVFTYLATEAWLRSWSGARLRAAA